MHSLGLAVFLWRSRRLQLSVALINHDEYVDLATIGFTPTVVKLHCRSHLCYRLDWGAMNNLRNVKLMQQGDNLLRFRKLTFKYFWHSFFNKDSLKSAVWSGAKYQTSLQSELILDNSFNKLVLHCNFLKNSGKAIYLNFTL